MIPVGTGPDEAVYLQQARTIREHGIRRGFRLLAERFDPAYPSPLRWGWVLAVAATLSLGRRALPLASLVACPLILVWACGSWIAGALALSPLLCLLGRRALQDAPIAGLVLVALGFALRAEPVGLAVTLVLLLATKEAAGLYIPALAAVWFVAGGSALSFAVAVTAAVVVCVVVWRVIFGRRWLTLFRRATAGHDTPYSREHQSGWPHRLLVDLFLVSPAIVLGAAAGFTPSPLLLFAATALLAHALAPIRNVRFVLAVDLALRAFVALTFPVAIPFLILIDVGIALRIRNVYDPVTHSLAQALGMPTPHVHGHGQ